MHQNRVDPEGQLHAVPDRLSWYGNKGCLHDSDGRVRRFQQGTRWITCVLDFKNRRRTLLQPGRYTELFFLDEASAYAAGHRPCAECRRAEFERFRALWSRIHGEDRVAQIDARLQAARMEGKARRTFCAEPGTLPVGALIRAAEGALLRSPTGWHHWSFSGYTPAGDPRGPVEVLTPEPFLRLFAEGLPVQIHPSATNE